MFNKVILIGRIGNKPTLKQSKDGKSYSHFSLATNSGFGEKKTTDWHSLIAFGKTAELCAQFLDKGSLIAVDGSIRYSTYERDGQKTQKTDILVDNITFLSKKNQEAEQNQSSVQYTQQPVDQYQQPVTQSAMSNSVSDNPFETSDEISMDDIPF